MLKPVWLTKSDSCYTYALKRVGLFNKQYSTIESNDFISLFSLKMLEDIDELVIGDILVFIKDREDNLIKRCGYISSDGELYYDEVSYNLHFMVYEGIRDSTYVVSDVDWVTNEKHTTLSIRMNDLKKLKNLKEWRIIQIPKKNFIT